jgi:hypothetical protein
MKVNKDFILKMKQLCQKFTPSVLLSARSTKQNFDFLQILESLHLIAATIGIQTWFRDKWLMKVNKDFILYQTALSEILPSQNPVER